MTLVNTYMHFSMPEDLHSYSGHMKGAIICHLGMGSFCHALDPNTSYKNIFDFLHLTV
jgi:hypothetical protein